MCSSDLWVLLAEAARAIDVRLELVGELPHEDELRRLAVMVAHECLNNAVRRGDARVVRVESLVRDGAYELVVTNDGRLPEGPVRESGGLANIRAAVERSGGTLEVTWAPEVRVVARLGTRE
mgnify:CR=1 FL=1